MNNSIRDEYGRSFQTLRVSLLSACNLGCVYCTMGTEEVKAGNAESRKNLQSAARLLHWIGQLHTELSLKTVRLTGGEPLLYPHLPEIIEGIREMGIPKIGLTTNGFLLQKQAQALQAAGLQSINVSLDAVEEAVFFLMSRRAGLSKVLAGIDAAVSAGLEVKINSVLMKGLNDQQVLPLLEFAFERNLPIRFLEVMNMGPLYGKADQYLVRKDEILHAIAARYDFVPVLRQQAATATYWKTNGGNFLASLPMKALPFARTVTGFGWIVTAIFTVA